MTAAERERFKGIHHLVHEYANFVSSAEMTIYGKDIEGVRFKPPINTHVSHAFYLNCRKQADFFKNIQSRGGDTILVKHYILNFQRQLPVHTRWRKRINKQLAHVTYTRDITSREIKTHTQKLLYAEIKRAWKGFRTRLPVLYAKKLTWEISKKKAPNTKGVPSEFRFYDLE